METKQSTMAEFLASAGITMKAVRAPGNPNMPDADPGMSHWRCTFQRNKGSHFGFYFSQGPAYTRAPEAGEVLDCLASDACSVENARSFDAWAGDMGYNADSRRAFKIYSACRKGARELKSFLGDDLYARLL